MSKEVAAQLEKIEEVKISGVVDSVTYRNDDNGFAVIVLDYSGDPLTVVGELGNVEEGEELELTGSFSVHPKFGRQFRAQTCIRSLPVEAALIQRLLYPYHFPLAYQIIRRKGTRTTACKTFR